MTYLAEALKKYYTREKTKIVFSNGLSLQQCAITLWEKLGFSQVDTSVLSRVLKGERLFTPIQLEAFCEVLKLSSSETAHLFRCLSQDHMLKGGASKIELLESTSVIDTLDFLDNLVNETYIFFHTGAGIKVQKNCAIIQTYTDKLSKQSLSETNKHKLYEIMATSLYLYGRSFCSYRLPEFILEDTKGAINELKKIELITKNPRVSVYLSILQAEVYYVAGAYSSSAKKKFYYEKAIELDKHAIKNLPVNDYERIAAMRNITASASYIKDADTISEMIKTARTAIAGASEKTRIVGLQLPGTLAKAAAICNLPQPEKLTAFAFKHYNADLTGGGVTEISDIKVRMETLELLGVRDKSYLNKLITKGLILAERENLQRHLLFFNQELHKLSY